MVSSIPVGRHDKIVQRPNSYDESVRWGDKKRSQVVVGDRSNLLENTAWVDFQALHDTMFN
eukprot:1550325-Rhodomonas_salina.1